MAYQFDGTNDWASLPIDLSAVDRLTVAFWFSWDAYATDNDQILEFSPNWADAPGGWRIRPNDNSGNFACNLRGNTGNNTNTYTRPSAATWHAAMAVFNYAEAAADEIKLYINGSLLTALTSGSLDNSSGFSSTSIWLGCRNAVSNFGACKIAELSLFVGTAHGATEAGRLAAGIPADAVTGCTNYWPMRDNGTAKVGGVDLTFGTSTAAPSVVAHPPAVRALRMVGGGHIRSLTGGGLAG